MDHPPTLSIADLKTLQKMDPDQLFTALKTLSPQKQKKYVELTSELLAASKPTSKAIKKSPQKKQPKLTAQQQLALAKAEKDKINHQKFVMRLFDIEQEVKHHVLEWEKGHSIVSLDIQDHQITSEEIALNYITHATTSLRQAQTAAFYNACVVGRRLFQVRQWWLNRGKEEGSFIDWVRKHIVGFGPNKLDAEEIRRFTSLGKLQLQFPKIIFIYSIAWKEFAKRPAVVREFIASTPERSLFWTSANTKMQIKTPTGLVPFMHLQQEGTKEPPEIRMEDMGTFDRILELEKAKEEKVRLRLAQEAAEEGELAADCDVESAMESD